MNAQLDTVQLRRLLAAATPRPWSQDQHYPDTFVWGPDNQMVADHESATGVIRMRGTGDQLPEAANAALIVAAVNALEPLLNQLVQQKQQLDQAITAAITAEQQLDWCQRQIMASGS